MDLNELLAQQSGLEGQDVLIQMLRKNAMQGVDSPKGEMVSGHYVAPNILQHIAAAMRPRQQRQEADSMEQAGIQKRVMLQRALQKARQDWMSLLPQGTPGQAPVAPMQGAPIERGGQMNPEAVGQPGIAPQLPNAMARMQWIERGDQIPGNGPLAMALGKQMEGEVAREDTQKEKREQLVAQHAAKIEERKLQIAADIQKAREQGANTMQIAQMNIEGRKEVAAMIAAAKASATSTLTPAQKEVHKRDIQRQIEHMESKVEPFKLVARAAQPVQDLLDEYTDEKTGVVKDIPGIGFTAKLGPLMGVAEHAGRLPKGSTANNAKVQTVINEILRANAGQAQTITEQANTLKSMLAGGNYNQKQFVAAWEDLVKRIDDTIKERALVASEEATETYLKRGGSLTGVKYKFDKHKFDKGPATLGKPAAKLTPVEQAEYDELMAWKRSQGK